MNGSRTRAWLICLCGLMTPGGASASAGASFQENFSTSPGDRGWATFGTADLFRWAPLRQELEVTWDSAKPNSFFYHHLGTILTASDDFSVSFDLRLQDILVGSTPGKTNDFEIAVGLVDYVSATNSMAFRGAGQSATYGVRNVVEFDYFPDSGYGDTFATTVISTNNRIFPAHNFPLTLSPGDLFRITMTNSVTAGVLHTIAKKNGAPFGLPPAQTLEDVVLRDKPDFRVNAFAVISYSDAIQAGPPAFHGSVLAHGAIDNVEWTMPPPPIAGLRLVRIEDKWHAQFLTRTNWVYLLEKSTQLPAWTAASSWLMGTGDTVDLIDNNATAESSFYRVRAERP